LTETAVAEAPAKVIITGEHFVVHGARALAAAIDLKVRAEVWRGGEGLSVRADSRGLSRTPDVGPVRTVIEELYRARNKMPALQVTLKSEIPSGSGLGSSAAAMTATVAAVAKLEEWPINEGGIIEAAMVGERKIHGKPSGVDVSVSVLGGVMLFKMGDAPKRVELPEEVKLIVVYSGGVRSTGTLISRVSFARAARPRTFSVLSDSVSMLSELASRDLTELRLEELGRIITLNHTVLGSVGASNVTLDDIVELCISLGCYGAKLTGAGGGGSVIAIPRPGAAEEISKEMGKRGFKSFVVTIPSGGVRAWKEGEAEKREKQS
jgi:mevalonate kinase